MVKCLVAVSVNVYYCWSRLLVKLVTNGWLLFCWICMIWQFEVQVDYIVLVVGLIVRLLWSSYFNLFKANSSFCKISFVCINLLVLIRNDTLFTKERVSEFCNSILSISFMSISMFIRELQEIIKRTCHNSTLCIIISFNSDFHDCLWWFSPILIKMFKDCA